MTRTQVMVLPMLAALALAGCKKEGAGSGVAALLPKDVAGKLSPGALAFAEALPGTTQGFGYLELGMPLEQLPQGFFTSYRGMFDDLLAMTRRRWNVDLSKVTGVGMVILEREPVFLAKVGLVGGKAPDLGASAQVKVAALGAMTAIGEPRAVDALLAASKQPPLYKAQPAWLRDALARGAGKPLFFSGSVPAMAKGAPRPPPEPLANVDHGTLTVGKDGAAMFAACQPGKAAALRGFLDTAMTIARRKLDQARTDLPDTGPGPLAKALLQRYSEALFQSVKLTTTGDEVAMTLAWRTPELGKPAPAPPLAERLIAKDEWAVAQIHFGGPMLDLLVALSDVLGTRIDRAAVTKELEAATGQALGLPGFNPSALTVSAGSEAILASLHTKVSGLPQESTPVMGGVLAALAQPWGVALTQAPQASALTEAAASPGAPLALLSTSKLAARDGMVRVFVDVTRLPAALMPPVPVPVQSVELVLTTSGFTAEVVAQPGQVKALTGPLDQLLQMVTAQAKTMYDARQSAPPQVEVVAIAQYHQSKLLAELLTPKVEGDRLRFARDFPPVQMQLMGGAALVGVLAAVAVPAFVSYQQRASAPIAPPLEQVLGPDGQPLDDSSPAPAPAPASKP